MRKVIITIELEVENSAFRNPYNDTQVDEIAVVDMVKRTMSNAYTLRDLTKQIRELNGNIVGSIQTKITE